MVGVVVNDEGSAMAGVVVRQMHNLVTYGPRDLHIACAMSLHGYDEAKWAEGQGVLAELVSAESPARATVAAALTWYEEAAGVARSALAGQPRALARLCLGAPCSQ